jgi:hypothetical protein
MQSVALTMMSRGETRGNLAESIGAADRGDRPILTVATF